jgi:uncharacterized membrane protein
MMIAFQIILFVLIVFMGLGIISLDTKENKLNYTSVTIAAIIALTVTFI